MFFVLFWKFTCKKWVYLTSCLLNLTQLKRSIKEGSEWVPNSNRSFASSNFSLFFRLRLAPARQLQKSIIVVVFVLINCIAPPACHFSLFFSIFLTKGRFFSESMIHCSHCTKNVPKTILKKIFWNFVLFSQLTLTALQCPRRENSKCKA